MGKPLFSGEASKGTMRINEEERIRLLGVDLKEILIAYYPDNGLISKE